MKQQRHDRHRSTSRTYSVLGALLGFGAPLGFLALRTLLARKPHRMTFREQLRAERAAYSYMTLATPIVFGTFGHLLGHRNDKLIRTQEQINRMRDELTAVTAHDLRTPLAALLLRLQLLAGDAKEGSVSVRTETLQSLEQSCKRMNRMVSDLLDATRIEAAKVRLDMVPTALPDAMSAIIERLRVVVGNHVLELVVDGSPPMVMADPTRLDQIVTNLVDNAAKYSADGTRILIEIHPDRGGVTLSVHDRGSGIAANEIPCLFDRYFQTERARANKSGLGLGLYITKGLVEAHGGTISVASEVNRGSTFSVWLPARVSQAESAPPQ